MTSARWALRGFTLLEVLVALAIVAIAFSALIKAFGDSINNAAYLRDKTLAHWTALNKIAELELNGGVAGPVRESGNYEMGGREWHWRSIVEKTDDPDVLRVEMQVRADEDEEGTLASLIGYLGRSQ